LRCPPLGILGYTWCISLHGAGSTAQRESVAGDTARRSNDSSVWHVLCGGQFISAVIPVIPRSTLDGHGAASVEGVVDGPVITPSAFKNIASR
jgi:hypothetical protein